MRVVITVLGKDRVGIIAKVSGACSAVNINVTDVAQSILGGLFAMHMLVEMGESTVSVSDLASRMDVLAEELGVKIHVVREDVLNYMHRV